MIHLKKNWRFLILILVIVNVLLSFWWLIHGDIHYDIDVSRDFLVIEDIIYKSHLTLLGPRSGAIAGIFHGPLWFYINVPAFVIGQGNPIIIGWFWVILSIINLFIVFAVTKKIFNPTIAILTVLLLSANSIINPSVGLKNFYNPYGAVFFSPIFFYCLYTYLKNHNVKYILLALLINGFIVQFEIAFGIPILILTAGLFFYVTFKHKLIKQLISLLILLIPFSTYIIFEYKHNFLQTRAGINYLTNNSLHSVIDTGFLLGRLRSAFLDCFAMLAQDSFYLSLFYAVFFFLIFFFIFKKASNNHKLAYKLFLYLYIGFWVVSLFYKGGTGNYSWPFLSLIIILLCSFMINLPKKIFFIFFVPILIYNMVIGLRYIESFNTDVTHRGVNSWAYNLQVAENVYSSAKGDFGYFIFTPDRFGYQLRYAMDFAGKKYPQKKSYSFIKKPLTYLIITDSPKDRSDISSFDWKISDIKIDRDPEDTSRIDVIKIERYKLSGNDLERLANPYLLDSAFLR